MRQRVVIALALCAEPELVIADEPTTALDVSVQAQIIDLLKEICAEHGAAVMLITHDMGVIAETADRVAVMYAGRIAEIGPVRDVIQRAAPSLYKGLMGSIPTLTQEKRPAGPDPGDAASVGDPAGLRLQPALPEKVFRALPNRTARPIAGQAAARSPAGLHDAAARPAEGTAAMAEPLLPDRGSRPRASMSPSPG
jgi:peptide/nickel transport system ATP-binding protein